VLCEIVDGTTRDWDLRDTAKRVEQAGAEKSSRKAESEVCGLPRKRRNHAMPGIPVKATTTATTCYNI